MRDFPHIALASAFSPRFRPLLAEARRVCDLLSRDLLVLHAGRREAASEQKFSEALDELGLSPEAIRWLDGEEPAVLLGRWATEHPHDLLIAGALEKYTEGRTFSGRIARALMRTAPCSLLLFTHPENSPRPWRQLVTVSDYSAAALDALRFTFELAVRAGAENVHVLRIFTIFAQVLAQPEQLKRGEHSTDDALAAEEEKLREFVERAGPAPVPVEMRCVEGTTGLAAADYVQSVEGDLLVIPAAAPGANDALPARMEWLYSTIPTNLLLLRSR